MRSAIAVRRLAVCVGTSDVHEHGKTLVEKALSGLGVMVIDGGVSSDPEILVRRAAEGGADVIAISTYNGVALRYTRGARLAGGRRSRDPGLRRRKVEPDPGGFELRPARGRDGRDPRARCRALRLARCARLDAHRRGGSPRREDRPVGTLESRAGSLDLSRPREPLLSCVCRHCARARHRELEMHVCGDAALQELHKATAELGGMCMGGLLGAIRVAVLIASTIAVWSAAMFRTPSGSNILYSK